MSKQSEGGTIRSKKWKSDICILSFISKGSERDKVRDCKFENCDPDRSNGVSWDPWKNPPFKKNFRLQGKWLMTYFCSSLLNLYSKSKI